MIWFILTAVIVVVLWFVFCDPNTKRIRDIQRLLNIDRSVCDVINSLDDWEIAPYNAIGLKIVIDPKVMPMYNMYITYKGKRPSNGKIKELHFVLTNEDSIVTKAHKQGVPVEAYMQDMEKGFQQYIEKKNNNENKTFIYVLRWLAFLPAIFVAELILRGIMYLAVTPFVEMTNMQVHIIKQGFDFVWILYFLFSIIEAAVFVKIGGFIATKDEKRVTTIVLASLKCFGCLSTLGHLMMLTKDLDGFTVIPLMAASITAVLSVKKKEQNTEIQDDKSADNENKIKYKITKRQIAIAVIILFYSWICYAR